MTGSAASRATLRHEQIDSRHAASGFWMCLALVIGNMIGSGVFPAAGIARAIWREQHPRLGGHRGGQRPARNCLRQAGPVVPGRRRTLCLSAQGIRRICGVPDGLGLLDGGLGGQRRDRDRARSHIWHELVPAIKQTVGGPAIVSCAIVWILTFLNWRGVRQMGVVQIVTTVLKVMPLLAIVVLADRAARQGRRVGHSRRSAAARALPR